MRGLPERWTRAERETLRKLSRPEAAQRFLDEELTYNTELDGETCRSPRHVLRTRLAHCCEAALLVGAAFRLSGRPPLVLQLEAERDDDHVLALFRHRGDHGDWGAVAKSSYAGLRYREPVHRTLRELALSYVEHFFNVEGEKSLRAYGQPVDLRLFDGQGWEWSDAMLWGISDHVATRRKTPLFSEAQARSLSAVDPGLLATARLPHGGVDNARPSAGVRTNNACLPLTSLRPGRSPRRDRARPTRGRSPGRRAPGRA